MAVPLRVPVAPELSIRTPDGRTQSILLDQPRYGVGRLATNELAFQSMDGLSRDHLALERQGAEWMVRDLGSTNGTFVNGKRIEAPTRLHPDDRITAGQLTLVFKEAAVPQPQDVVFVESSPDLEALTTTATLHAALEGEQGVGGDRHMQALIRAGRELAGRMPLENLFELILNLSVETVGASRGALMILENGELQVRATLGAGLRISSSVRDMVLKERRSLLVRDALTDRAFSGRESIVQQQIRSILAVPLQTEERVIGLVYLDSPFLVHEFKNEDLNLLTVMANIAAIRIEHARLAQIEQAEKIRAQELEHAALIQRSILPSQFPAFPHRTEFELHAAMVPAKEVGGDLFDFFLLDDDHLGFVIGDVSGKGVPAALFMAVSRTLLRATARHEPSPGQCFAHVNETLMDQNVSSMFVTMLYGVLDLRSGQLQFANAGHNPAYVFSADGALRALTGKSGPMLGIFGAHQYRTLTDCIKPGETILLYTDGVTEARSKLGEFYGDERLQKFILDHAGEDAVELTRNLQGAVQEFSAGTPQFDDITVLALRYSSG
ncbi:MAG TPA: SpoIIE family protein phosphatase [Bryobacteraceae bacterium]|nr:SpoIIE family protein phosphatase [Bryobacteraceae bacterium]